MHLFSHLEKAFFSGSSPFSTQRCRAAAKCPQATAISTNEENGRQLFSPFANFGIFFTGLTNFIHAFLAQQKVLFKFLYNKLFKVVFIFFYNFVTFTNS